MKLARENFTELLTKTKLTLKMKFGVLHFAEIFLFVEQSVAA